MTDYCIRYIELPYASKGVTVQDAAGFYNIYINSLLSYDEQKKAVAHELPMFFGRISTGQILGAGGALPPRPVPGEAGPPPSSPGRGLRVFFPAAGSRSPRSAAFPSLACFFSFAGHPGNHHCWPIDPADDRAGNGKAGAAHPLFIPFANLYRYFSRLNLTIVVRHRFRR